MAMDTQVINIVGRLGRDPESKFDANGNAITNFSVACNNRDDSTTWYRVTAFGRLGEICNEYLTKGKQVFISGAFAIRTYTDKDGNERQSYDVNANSMQMLGSRNDTQQEADDAPAQPQRPARPAPPAGVRESSAARVAKNRPVPVDEDSSLPF